MLLGAGVLMSSELDVRVDEYNRRVRFVGPERPAVFDRWLASSTDLLEKIGKVIIYARDDDDRGWERRGFVSEGRIVRFFADGRDASVWSKFLDEDRGTNTRQESEDQIGKLAESKADGDRRDSFPPGFESRIADVSDAGVLADLLQSTFRDYPDPISTETVTGWIRNRARLFRVVEQDGKVVACASAEIDAVNRSAELTDCATKPEMRGKGLMTAILAQLERDTEEQFGITDYYTLARAGEAGINIAFARIGYEFTGRLVNNCRMPDGWESMNAWCRRA